MQFYLCAPLFLDYSIIPYNGMYFEMFVSLQTDEEWEEDELGKGDQGVSISHLLGESGYQGWWWFSCDTCVVLLFY
jgi:hypothetical protein